MPNITYRRTGELLRKLFEILMSQPEGMQAKNALTALANNIELTEFEKGYYDSGSIRIDKIVRFATIDCARAGWFLKNKGTWTITDKGRLAHSSFTDPEIFYKEAVKLYGEWKRTQTQSTVESPAANEEDISDESNKEVSITFEQAEEQSWEEIQQFLREINPYDFQELVASLLRAMGYHVSWISPPGKDGGIDILAYGDPLGTKPPRIKVQVKRMEQSITVDGLRSFMALLSDDDVGLFVTTGSFTKDARNEARTQEKRKITLIDLERLFDLWTEYYSALDDAARRRFPLRPIYFLAPEGK